MHRNRYESSDGQHDTSLSLPSLSRSGNNDDLPPEKEIEGAYDKISDLFLHSACFQGLFLFYDSDDENNAKVAIRSQVVSSVDAAFEVIELLEKFPILASRRYAYLEDLDDDDDTCYPLAFFVWSKFSIRLVQRVYNLYPDAINQQQGPCESLLHYCCGTEMLFQAPNLVAWVASNVKDTFDTSEPLLDVLLDPDSDFLYDNDSIKELAESLLSKDPHFTGTSKSRASRVLGALWVLGCDRKVIRKTLCKLPSECRSLNFTRQLTRKYCDNWEGGYFLPSDSDFSLLTEMLPELTYLEFELFPWEDRVIGVLVAINEHTALRKLTLSICTELVYIQQDWIDEVKHILKRIQPTSTEVRLWLEERFNGDMNWYYDCTENYNSVDDDKSITMETVNNEFIEYILATFRGFGGCGRPPIVHEIEIFNLVHPVYYELVAQLSHMTLSLHIVDTNVVSKANFSPSLCEVWKHTFSQCMASCCHPSTKALRRVVYTIHRSGLCLGSMLFRNDVELRPKLVLLRLSDRHASLSRDTNVTSAMVSLLKCGTLETLQLFGTTRGCRLELSAFSKAFVSDGTLERLELSGVEFCRNDGRSISQWFLQMLQDNPFKRLNFLSIQSKLVAHFDNDDLAYVKNTRDHLTSPEADQIQYLLWMNKYGRVKFDHGNTDINVLVELLGEVNAAKFPTRMSDMNGCCSSTVIDVKLSLLYDFLKASPPFLYALSGSTTVATTRCGKKRKHSASQQD